MESSCVRCGEICGDLEVLGIPGERAVIVGGEYQGKNGDESICHWCYRSEHNIPFNCGVRDCANSYRCKGGLSQTGVW